MKSLVIIPTYNERENIDELLDGVLQLLEGVVISSLIVVEKAEAVVSVPVIGTQRNRLFVCGFCIRDAPRPDLTRWEEISHTIQHPDGEVELCVIDRANL